MGCVYNRGTKAKPNFWIRWRDRYGRLQYAGVGTDRQLAKAALRKKEHDVDAQRFDIPTGPPAPVPTFDAAADAFISRRKAPDAEGKPMRRSWKDDRARLDKYLRPRFGKKHLDELHEGDMRQLIDQLRGELKPQSIRNCLAIVSRIYNEQPRALRLDNPVAGLDRADRDAIGPGWDPKATPWLRDDQVRAIYLAMPEMSREVPWRAMFAVGTLAGLRTGEVIALEWGDVDFQARTIHVRRSVDGPLKDDESRIAPLPDTLAAVLTDLRKLAPVGAAQVFQSTGHGGRHRKDGKAYVKEHSLGRQFRAALAKVNAERREAKLPELPAMRWYEATRHSFASRYVQAGGSLMKLASILGHSATEVTLRYAHLQPGNFTEQERALVDVQLAPAKVLPLPAPRRA
jgi:integrase